MNTLILVSVLFVVFTVVAVVLFKLDFFVVPFILMFLSAFLLLSIPIISVEIWVRVPKEMAAHEYQKQYIESLEPDELMNVGVTETKIAFNGSLFRAQYSRERFGNWSVYPESVLDLEPIK